MPFAICLYGYTGHTDGRNGYGEKINPEICYNHIRKHILEKNKDVDIFIHTWEKDHILDKIFKPKNIVTEEQKFFGFEDEIEKLNKDDSLYKSDKFCFFNNFSSYYSLLKSVELAREFEESKNIEYQNIFVFRLDCAVIQDINLSSFDNNFVHFSPKLKNGNPKPLYPLRGKGGDNVIIHNSFGFIISSKLLKRTRYREIFTFNYKKSDSSNYFKYDNFLERDYWDYQNVLLEKNNFTDYINPFSLQIIRRYYYTVDKQIGNNGVLTSYRYNSEKERNERWDKYKNYYSI